MDKSVNFVTLLPHLGYSLWIKRWKYEGSVRKASVRMDALLKLSKPERGWDWVGVGGIPHGEANAKLPQAILKTGRPSLCGECFVVCRIPPAKRRISGVIGEHNEN